MARFSPFFLLLALSACGGVVVDSSSDGGPDATPKDGALTDGTALTDGSSSDGGTTVTVGCPADAPAPGTACAPPGALCEYGTAFWTQCDDVFKCNPKTDTWFARPKDTSLCAADSQSCPATFKEAKGTCTPFMDCDYPEGYCECVVTCGGPPGGPQDYFACAHPYQGCPYPRPRLGTACSNEGQQCNYQVCCTGTNMTCKGGTWQGLILDQPCP